MNNNKKISIAIATINKDHNKIIKESKILNKFKIQIINSRKDIKKICNKNLEYIFFIHWRWKVDQSLLDNYECVCFHMTNLPFGRGGSPLQNLILKRYKETNLTAFKMNNFMDAGPIYLKKKLSLSGSASQIYERATINSLRMINNIVKLKIKPKAQRGKITNFKRRKSSQSKIDSMLSLRAVYDFIRMLDAPGYPQSFIDYKKLKMLFSNATLKNNKLTATVEFKIKKNEKISNK